MTMKKKKLPIGIENFEELQKEEFYYVDKTNLIRDLLMQWSKVNLFTRPRRFGKSLNMSMLKYFFEPGGDKEIFKKLAISGETEICEKYMGKFPVVSISLKGINGESYEKACAMAVQVIQSEARRFQYLLESERLTAYEKKVFASLLQADMGEDLLCSSLKIMSELLEKHHGCKVILLIDEYDVPLPKAFERGYYDQMVIFIRNMFEYALKTNDSLKFAVLTGCMRISKESIFTGLNNIKVLSVADVQFDEYFGFTDQEVKDMLDYYGFSDKYDEVKEWYDGYQFGNVGVYCPWDVINYCDTLKADPDAQPRNYWLNTSSNEAVRRFIRESDHAATRREIEKLVAGEVITKEIHQELTYKDMYDSIDNLWSVLFTTGYLTQRGKPDGDNFRLVIPNVEIRKIFTSQIMEFFKESVPKNGEALRNFCQALRNGDAKSVERLLGEYLRKTISIRDTFVKRQMKENFYHGILIGILGFEDTWSVSSNKESGDGYSDILVETDDGETGIILELKYAEDGKLDESCLEALRQINLRRYEEEFLDEGVEHILKYGIAFYKKRCRVMIADVDTDH
ncbi:AAA family ATPase [Blautia massiliensis]|uniref:AAA family ATPase n=1 Tax=Blautia TaxID=572511 RepID=UPI001570FB28|nr:MULTISPECIES: AAA family ATPase [Blautia]MCC2726139.1 ATP-binding protein [Blautia sp. MSK22_86]NSF57026.1 AAA family ATPase [Blautia massiliensis (ex Durand et al. 2017)]NSK72371.1 AAA family ATPase [Blautia massiliensis (ex Durand et al. 2017)]